MEWWVWVLPIIVLLVVAVVIWYWWRGRSGAASSAYVRPTRPSTIVKSEEAILPAAPAPAAAESAAAVADAGTNDDLTLIEGIGPKIASALAAADIRTFVDLADADPADLERILRDANLPLAKPATWPAQARLAADGRTEELQRMQDSLKGGR